MQTLILTIQDDVYPQIMEFITGFSPDEIKIEDIPQNIPPQHVVRKRDLSKLIAHENVVDGDLEDLVNMNWEHEIHVNFPK